MKNLNFLRHKPIWHTIEFYEDRMSILFILSLLCPRTYGRGNKHCFCQSVCPSVAYIANNSRTQRPSVPKFGRKVPHLDATHTSFKVKRSKVSVGGSRGHTVSAEPGGHIACFMLHCITCLSLVAYDILTSRPVRELHVTYGNLPVNLGIPRLRFWVRCSMYQILQTSVQCQNADY